MDLLWNPNNKKPDITQTRHSQTRQIIIKILKLQYHYPDTHYPDDEFLISNADFAKCYQNYQILIININSLKWKYEFLQNILKSLHIID
jgi:hypothetical protein